MPLNFTPAEWRISQHLISNFTDSIDRISHATSAGALVNELRDMNLMRAAFVQGGIRDESINTVLHEATGTGVTSVQLHGAGFTFSQMQELINLSGIVPFETPHHRQPTPLDDAAYDDETSTTTSSGEVSYNNLPLHRQIAPRYDEQ